jgi:acyl-coenzyme A thioesterase PaaI-like protein
MCLPEPGLFWKHEREALPVMPDPPLAIQDLYPDDFAHCFGCGRHNPRGHHLKSHVEGDAVVARFTPAPEHVSLPGFVYGGLIASLIDCHAMACAAAAAERAAGRRIGDGPAPRFVTASLKVTYLAPTPLTGALVLRGVVRERSERKALVDITVTAGADVTVRGEVVAVRMPPGMGRAPATG